MLAIAGIAHAQTEKQPFTITLKAGTPQVKMGGQVILDVTMTNTSDHEIDCSLYYYDLIDTNYPLTALYTYVTDCNLTYGSSACPFYSPAYTSAASGSQLAGGRN